MANPVTAPDTLEMIIGERLDCSWDFGNLIAPGDSCASPTVTIINATTNESVPTAVIGTPFVLNGTIIKATLTSTPLRRSTFYNCMITATVTGGSSSKTISALLVIDVVY